MTVEWSVLFGPSYSPEEMLKEGIFEGKYINSVKGIPTAWKKLDKVLTPKQEPDPTVNKFGVKSRQPLSVWRENKWIKTDKNGWFEWYIHYYLGRRLGEEDLWQINRWRSFVARHQGQIVASCKLTDDKCHAKQRQGLLQWGWDSHSKFDPELVVKNAKRLASKTGGSISTESISLDKSLPNW